MSPLILSVFSWYEVACKYRIIFQISTHNWMQNCISDTWPKNFQSGKAITETWFNLFYKWKMFLKKPKLNQINLLLTFLHAYKQFISHKLRPPSSSHGQLRELVFLFSHGGSHFFETSHQIISRTVSLSSFIF